MSKKADNRLEFSRPEVKGMSMSAMIITDSETGVQYLVSSNSIGTAMSVMLDKDGKPYIKQDN